MVESDDDTGMSYDCVSSPLGAELPSKLKRKNVKSEYVNMAEMLSPNQKEASSFQFKDMKGGNTFKLVSQPNKKEIDGIEQLTDAYMVFVSVISEFDPLLAPGLWKYGRFIRNTAKKFGGKVWKDYDEKFRKQLKHHQLAWHQVHRDLYFSLVNFSRSSFDSQKSFRPSKFKSSKKPFEQGQCFNFESQGKCPKKNCPFRHACVHCRKRHQSSKCFKLIRQPAHVTNSNQGKQAGLLATNSRV